MMIFYIRSGTGICTYLYKNIQLFSGWGGCILHPCLYLIIKQVNIIIKCSD